MNPISVEEFEQHLHTFRTESDHLEMRDSYGTAVELPHMAKWLAGQPDDLSWLQEWCDTLREATKDGKTVRRTRIVSEPLSDYQRWSYSIAHPMVAAGEDIRWVARRSVSSIALPGNDFYLLDNELVIFLTYTGNGLAAERLVSVDPADVALCRAAFDAVWTLTTPHSEYQPV